MKKLISLAAALAVAAGAAALPAGAAMENVVQSRIWNEEIEMFDAFDKGEIPTDVNGDGTFDLIDCLIYYAYCEHQSYGDEYNETLEAIGNLNGDDFIDSADATHFNRYYIYSHPISINDLDRENYADYEIIYEIEHKDYFTNKIYISTHSIITEFLNDFSANCTLLMAGYNAYCEYVDNGTIDPDLNADGKSDLTDLVYFLVYSMDNEIISINSPYNLETEENDEILARAKALYKALPDGDFVDNWIYNYTVMYYFEKGEVTPDMITDEFFESVVEGSSVMDPARLITEDYYFLIPQNDAYIDGDPKMFDRECEAYIKAIDAGEISIPDTNGDGIIDPIDDFNVYIYQAEQRNGVSEEESILPADIFRLFKNDMDINCNGLSGDKNDLDIISLVYFCFPTERGVWDAMSGQYHDILNEYAAKLTTAKNMLPVKFSPDWKYESLGFDADVERSGDANNDSSTDLADAIFIMQSIANPDKYQLTPLGKFNADVDGTGNGITNYDALAIQSQLLNLG